MGLAGMEVTHMYIVTILLLLYSKQLPALRNLIMGLDEIDVIFKLATLDELDDVSNLKQSIWT